MKIVQIGCGNGNDEVYDLISKTEINFALLIDANPYVLELAKELYKNIKNVKFESRLISENAQELSFIIPHFDSHPYSAHSSIYESHVIKHGHDINRAKILKLKSTNINELFAEYNLSELDYLYIDCEGEDYNIINSIDFNKIKIKNIIFEHSHIEESKLNNLKNKLISINYKVLAEDNGNIKFVSEGTIPVILQKKSNMIKKIYFSSFNKNTNGQINDGWAKHNFIEYGGFKHLNVDITSNIDDSDIIVYIRTYEGKNFIFDIELAKKIIEQNKKIIVLDYIEYGSPTVHTSEYLYDIDILGYNVSGKLLHQILNDYGNEGQKLIDYFNKFREHNLIYCYFKRELSSLINLNDSSFPIYSADFMNHEYQILETKNENDFNDKSINLFFTWGLSSNDRPKLHGKILQEVDKYGNIILSQKHLEHSFENNIKNLLFLCKTEWFERVDYKKYIPHCKTIVDLYGAGMKCFRNLESALDSVSFKQDPSLLLHAYPWENGKNCIFLPNKENNKLNIDVASDIIYDYIKINQGKLFEIYKESKNTAKKYINEEYTKNYIYPKIEGLLNL